MRVLLLSSLVLLAACGRSGLWDFGAPGLAASPAVLDLGGGLPDGGLLWGEVTLTNTSRVTVERISARVEGAGRPGRWSVSGAPPVLEWGQGVRLTVGYQPALPPGVEGATLVVTSNAAAVSVQLRAGTLDPCVPEACRPARTVCEGEGACVAGVCVHPARPGLACDDQDLCTLVDACTAQGVCRGTPVACDQPPAQRCVDADRLAVYPAGTCAGGVCRYEPTVAACPFGCVSDRCYEPCQGVVCNAPPSACHQDPGVCQPQGPRVPGRCVYDFDDGKQCSDGNPCTVADACRTGVCVGQPLQCTTPPAPRCVDADHSEVWASPGQCVAGACVYTPRTDFCSIACLRGQCQASCAVSLVAGSSAGFAEGTGAAARFNTPYGLAVDSAGTVFVNDTSNDRVRQIVGQAVTTVPGGANLGGPHDVALDGAGGLLVGAQGAVLRIFNGVQTRLAGTGFGGPALDGPALSATFGNEVSVWGSSAGTLYVADADNHRLRTVAGGQVGTLAGTTAGALQDGFNPQARFNHPHELIGVGSDLLVADTLNHAVRRVSPTQTTTIAGNGTPGMVNGALAAARFNSPLDVSVDPEGALYVADTLNQCIRRISPTRVTTFAGVCGLAGYLEGQALQARFRDPAGVAVSKDAVFYVSDMENHRVRRIDCTPVTP